MPRFMASPMRTCRQTPSASCSTRVSTRRSFASSGTVAFSFSSAVYSSISCTVRLSMSVSATRPSVSAYRDARAYITGGFMLCGAFNWMCQHTELLHICAVAPHEHLGWWAARYQDPPAELAVCFAARQNVCREALLVHGRLWTGALNTCKALSRSITCRIAPSSEVLPLPLGPICGRNKQSHLCGRGLALDTSTLLRSCRAHQRGHFACYNTSADAFEQVQLLPSLGAIPDYAADVLQHFTPYPRSPQESWIGLALTQGATLSPQRQCSCRRACAQP